MRLNLVSVRILDSPEYPYRSTRANTFLTQPEGRAWVCAQGSWPLVQKQKESPIPDLGTACESCHPRI